MGLTAYGDRTKTVDIPSVLIAGWYLTVYTYTRSHVADNLGLPRLFCLQAGYEWLDTVLFWAVLSVGAALGFMKYTHIIPLMLKGEDATKAAWEIGWDAHHWWTLIVVVGWMVALELTSLAICYWDGMPP